jgi:hypothetical protein
MYIQSSIFHNAHVVFIYFGNVVHTRAAMCLILTMSNVIRNVVEVQAVPTVPVFSWTTDRQLENMERQLDRTDRRWTE